MELRAQDRSWSSKRRRKHSLWSAGLVTHAMSDAQMIRLIWWLDISYHAEGNGEIGHRQNAEDYWHSIVHFSDTIEKFCCLTGKKCVESCAISAQRIRH
eukprot:7212796-Heterocapsa_arctica.AAC.1